MSTQVLGPPPSPSLFGSPAATRQAEPVWREVLNVRVVGIPKAQPRARAFARNFGGKVSARMYDPGTAECWKADVAAAVCTTDAPPIEGAVLLSVDFLFPRPKKLMRKCDPAGRILTIAKPDTDNALKAIMDCLTQKSFWRDDAQVHLGPCLKWYAGKSEQAGAEIRIAVLEDAQ